METFKIKPVDGLSVLDPLTCQPLKSDGEEKPRNTYWLRRIKDQSVAIVENTKQATTKAAQSSKKDTTQ
ncbi:DUF2635 domain-containing protein [Vibrio furnissii]|uniref:DUF2635 domain-containing protein n=1 Tax=Vibrio furnissii TaxID=29494 RepID=UPI001559F347|nr:DUF2635 domain-containing protein [Vibrio furnissii]